MRNFLATVLVLVFFETIALSYMPRSLAAHENMFFERGANMTTREPFENNAVEVNGIRFETVMPERVPQIPPRQPDAKTQFQLGIQITNNTANPRRFLLFAARPEFLQTNMQKVQQFGPNAYRTEAPELSHFQLLMPGKSIIFLVEGYFHWVKNELKFVFRRNDGVYWWFGSFKSGIYWVKVTYENPYPAWEQASWGGETIFFRPMRKQQIYNPPISDSIKIEDVWVGEVSPPPVEFQLIYL